MDFSAEAWAIKHRVQTVRPRTAIRRVMVMQAEIRLRHVERMRKRKEVLERKRKEELARTREEGFVEQEQARLDEERKRRVHEYGTLRGRPVKDMKERRDRRLPPVKKPLPETVKRFVIKGGSGETDRTVYYSAEKGPHHVLEAYADSDQLPSYIFMPIKPASSLTLYSTAKAKKSLSSALGFSSRDFFGT